MRPHHLALAAFGLALLAPAAAPACPRCQPTSVGGVGEGEANTQAGLELERLRVLTEIELSRGELGDLAADLLRERTELARRADQLGLVAQEGFEALDAIRDGLLDRDSAGELLLRSPAAVLLRQEDRPRLLGRGGAGGVTWTRGSWMDSPDGASN